MIANPAWRLPSTTRAYSGQFGRSTATTSLFFKELAWREAENRRESSWTSPWLSVLKFQHIFNILTHFVFRFESYSEFYLPEIPQTKAGRWAWPSNPDQTSSVYVWLGISISNGGKIIFSCTGESCTFTIRGRVTKHLELTVCFMLERK